ncbi:hypothetical protein [Methylobacterium sp. Leaf118]|uniref:hypothetical protein n=1 Tax=Methylobacterium sp. Leaf118 TaxID=2876562 RepID=UPI001E52A76E|nr:hypothetical protein [Methylobacterium sp. Leaf118]
MRPLLLRLSLGLLCLAPALPIEASAAGKVSPAAARTAPADPAPKPGTTWTAAEPEPAHCSRVRRKLWQESEGWIVKTVNVCR